MGKIAEKIGNILRKWKGYCLVMKHRQQIDWKCGGQNKKYFGELSAFRMTTSLS